MSDKLKNIWKQSKTKDYTTIEPTQKSSLYKRFKRSINRDTIPDEIKERKNQPLVRDYNLSKNRAVQLIQKKFTKKGKKAVEDLKLKSLKK
jgi:hypothetical protein|tara:strand:+ start:3924 stop:4196 length:273 start_codon:yes stop_codon:yes gene_type:complete